VADKGERRKNGNANANCACRRKPWSLNALFDRARHPRQRRSVANWKSRPTIGQASREGAGQ